MEGRIKEKKFQFDRMVLAIPGVVYMAAGNCEIKLKFFQDRHVCILCSEKPTPLSYLKEHNSYLCKALQYHIQIEELYKVNVW